MGSQAEQLCPVQGAMLQREGYHIVSCQFQGLESKVAAKVVPTSRIHLASMSARRHVRSKPFQQFTWAKLTFNLVMAVRNHHASVLQACKPHDGFEAVRNRSNRHDPSCSMHIPCQRVDVAELKLGVGESRFADRAVLRVSGIRGRSEGFSLSMKELCSSQRGRQPAPKPGCARRQVRTGTRAHT